MKTIYEILKELGIFSELVYQDKYFRMSNRETQIDNTDHNQLTGTFEVKATQDDLISSWMPDVVGFQAMLLQDTQSGEYVIAFRGTEFHPLSSPYQTGVLFRGHNTVSLQL